MKKIDFIVMSIALTCGNLFYQWFTTVPDFGLAAERSYFQVIALAIFYFVYGGKYVEKC